MPIFVKEVVIRAVVGETQRPQAEQGQSSMNSEAAVKAAVAEVLRIMKDKKNR